MPDIPRVNGAAPGPCDALLISPADTARRLSMSLRKLFALTKSGAIPSRRIGRLVRYSTAELAAWVAAGCPTTPIADTKSREAGKGDHHG